MPKIIILITTIIMYNIAVIGCGAIGVTSALAIQKELLGSEFKVVILTDAVSPNTTSDVAAGLWGPYLCQNTPKEDILKWSKLTQDYLQKLWKKGEADKAGISLIHKIVLTQENYSPPEYIKLTLGHCVLSEQKIEYYSRVHGQEFTTGHSTVVFTWEASKFLPYLQQKFLNRGGEIVISHVDNFETLADFDVVVNCTGIHSQKLVPDPSVYPIRGQLCRVEASWQLEAFSVSLKDGRGCYIIPNHNSVILGGTAQGNDYNTEVDEQDKKSILERSFRFIPSLKNAAVVRDSAGLRPARPTIRVELETKQFGDKLLKIVHNYGHGGSGITLSVGCAVDAAKLVKEALQITNLNT